MLEVRKGADGRDEVWALRPVRLAVFEEAGLADRFVEMLYEDGDDESAFEVTIAGRSALDAQPAVLDEAEAAGAQEQDENVAAVQHEPAEPVAAEAEAEAGDEDDRMAAALEDAKAGMGIVAAAGKHGVKMAVLRGKFAMWKSLASDAELLAYEAARDRFRGVAP